MRIEELRKEFHARICKKLLRIQKVSKKGNYPNNADGDSNISTKIAWGIVERICDTPINGNISGQRTDSIFQGIVKNFIQDTFGLLHHIRPGNWVYSINEEFLNFEQTKNLDEIDRVINLSKELSSSEGFDYFLSPDIVIGRMPESEKEINKHQKLVSANQSFAKLTPIRQVNIANPIPILHASISCKWTIRSDRAQNSRTEALNLIRNRKGKLPHIVAVTAEPTTTRIASLALGTGDIDCVYHFALNELRETIIELGDESQLEMLNILIDGRRLRDISDLPFDLAI